MCENASFYFLNKRMRLDMKTELLIFYVQGHVGLK